MSARAASGGTSRGVAGRDASTDVAIVGMACVLPGARSLEDYWENILHKVSAVGDPPPDWEAGLYVDPTVEANNRIYCARGGYLGDLAQFAPVDHGVMPNSVDGGEPDHFLALAAAFRALADAGYAGRELPKDRVEVIIGRGSYVNRGNTTAIQHGIVVDQVVRVLKQLHPEHTDAELDAVRAALTSSLPPFHAETAPALVPNIISGRIANRLDFMGPNFIVDAACASSLIAVDLGMRDLASGRCDVAVVGGVHASTPPVIMMIFCQLKAISRSGEIRPFDARADGTLLGEGVGMIVLKRLADAERDGDRIYAVVKGVGTASDGKALGLLAPRVEGEELALRRAYEAAGVDPATVALIEAHGTATPVGDVVEIEALKRVFGTHHGDMPTVALGSVKSMISHLMPASGIAGLIKVALALHHKVLPPTINCESPNPKLGLEESPFYLNTQTRPWIHGESTPRRAGVNAFGFGGINAHAVLEEHTGRGARDVSLARRWDSEVLVLSAPDRAELVAEAERLLGRLEGLRQVPLKDLAYTINVKGPAEPTRLAIVATSIEDLEAKLRRAVEKLREPRTTRIREIEGIYYTDRPLAREGRMAWVFPGEGSQYPHMLADLCVHFPEVREFFDLMDRAFTGHRRSYLPSQVIFPPSRTTADEGRNGKDLIWRMDAGAEAVFAANQALAGLLRMLGVSPEAVVGHSTGEHSALLVAGAVAVRDDTELMAHIKGVNAVFERHEVVGIPEALLVAVGGADLSAIDDLVERSQQRLFVAMDNCPHQVVLCGTKESATSAVEELQRRRAICQVLPFRRPYHTPWFEFFCGPLREYFEQVTIRPTAIDVYSCVTAGRFPTEPAAVRDLVSMQWAKPVRFRETVEQMHLDGVRIFVEVGPRNNLTGFIDDTLRRKPYVAIPSNVEHRSGIGQLNHLVAQLAAHGVDVRLDALYARRAPQEIDLAAGAPPTRRPMSMRLATGLQAVRLPAGFRLQRSQGNGTGPAPGMPTPTAASATPSGSPRASLGGPVLPGSSWEGTQGISEPAAPPAPFAQAPPARAAGQVMQAHIRTMAQFLEAQTAVTRAFLQRARSRPAGPEGVRPPGVAAGAARAEPAPPPVKAGHPSTDGLPARGPFVGAVTALVPGRQVTATRRFSLDDDPFLLDHTLGRDISVDDPELTALPVIPLTVTMEVMAETGALLQPGKVLVHMRHVRAYRWITVEQPVELETSAHCRIAEPGTVDVAVRQKKSNGAPAPPIAEATLVFRDAWPAPEAAGPLELKDERPSGWEPSELYRRGMFHGPRFRAVERMTRSGSDGTTAIMTTLPASDLVRGFPRPAFVTDPVLLDGAGQVVAFWAMERLPSGVDIFPYRLDGLRLFGPGLPPGTRTECRVRTGLFGDVQMRSDIDIVPEGSDRVWCRFEGWEDRRFELPRRLIELRSAPGTALLSEAWDPPAVDQSGAAAERVAGAWLNGLGEDLLESHGGIWLKMLAYLVLGRRERETWNGLPDSPRRRREWLLGRCAAKDAVRRLVLRSRDVHLCSADIEIIPDSHGRPQVRGAWKERLKLDVAVSLSHKGGTAVGLAALGPGRRPGIDIEFLKDFPLRTGTTLAFDERETAVLGRIPQERRAEWAVRAWCAKEAVGKAVGRGLEAVLSALRVVAVREATGLVEVAVAKSRREQVGLAGEPVLVASRRDGDVVSSGLVL